jgi:hypothetical protein
MFEHEDEHGLQWEPTSPIANECINGRRLDYVELATLE